MQTRLILKMAGRERGVALLIAMVVLAIAATLSTAMIWDRELDVRRFANIKQGDQALEYALGAEAWAEQILRRDFQSNQGNTNLTQDWAMQLPSLPVEGGSITGNLQDLQGLFNVNNLASKKPGEAAAALLQFQRLLVNLGLDPGIASAVYDWVNAGNQPSNQGGAKDEFYTQLAPPYLTAQQPMTSISELLLVKGVTPQVYLALLPDVCALPLIDPGSASNTVMHATAININTAPAAVIASLNTNISLSTAEAAVQTRTQHVFQSFQELTVLGISAAGSIPPPTVTSSYFRLTALVQIGDTQITLYSLLYRASNGATIAIRRTYGTL
jgi:general secretion pathway protein K